jgi:hypothetical protein
MYMEFDGLLGLLMSCLAFWAIWHLPTKRGSDDGRG